MSTNLDSAVVIAGDDVLDSQYNNLRKDIIKNAGDYEVAGGTGDVITLSIDAQYVAYAAGDKIRFQASATNTGAVTINVNSIGAKTIKKYNNQELEALNIESGQEVELVYDGVNFQIISPIDTSIISSGFSTIWDDVSFLTAIDAGAPTITVANGMALDTGIANTSKGYRLPGGSLFHIFGGNSTAELSFVGKPRFNATGAAPIVFGVIGDLGAGTSSVQTNEHIGFKFVLGNNTITTYATNANGTTQTTTDLSVSDSDPHVYTVRYDGTEAKFYIDGVLKATHTTNLPSGTSTAGVNTFYFVFDADGNSNPSKGMYIKSAEYRLIN